MEIFIKEIYIKKNKNGKGILKYNNGDIYERDWINDKKRRKKNNEI